MQLERFAMEAMQKPRDDHDEVAELLSRARSMITAGGCADRIDAERWLTTWLDTPNSAFSGVEPQRLLEQAYNDSTTVVGGRFGKVDP
jgi:hypothetical protein